MSKRAFLVPDGQYPPFAVLSDNDHEVWILIASSLGMTCALVFGGIRAFIRKTINPPFGADDILLAAATLIAFVQTCVVLNACSKGLGKSIELISDDEAIDVQQLHYASNLLFLVTIALTKISVITILIRLSPMKRHQSAFGVAGAVVVAWTIASVLAVALQCQIEQPWKSLGGDCSGSSLRWTIINIFDILTEAGIITLAVYTVWSLQTSIVNKLTVVSLFSFRLGILIPIAFRSANFDNTAFTTNPTLRLDLFIVWTQTEMYFSLMSATMPILRPFMSSLATQHGGLGLSGTIAGYSQSSSRSRSVGNYKLSAMKSKLSSAHNKSEARDGDEENILIASQNLEHKHSIATTRDGKDKISRQSHNSEHLMIRKDMSFTITHEA